MTSRPSENILLVIPVFNHSATIKSVVQKCLRLQQRLDIVVVDDGSTENVADALAGLDVTVLRHEKNRGKGQAILTAARHAEMAGKTHIITLDADGQHYPEQSSDFIDAIQKHPSAIIIGVRNLNADNVPISSKFGRAFGNFWVRVQTGVKMKDIQSGYRAYPVFMLNRLHCLFRSYAFENEVVVRAAWAGIPISQIPIETYYPPQKTRVSHFRRLRDNLKLAMLNFYLTIRSIVPWPHHQYIYENNDWAILSAPLKILKEQLRQRDTPIKLALAGGIGVFIGALPLIAVHSIVIMFVASHLRVCKIVAITASQLCMPPIVPALCIETGYYLRFGRFLTLRNISSLREASFTEIGYFGLQRVAEWFLGALIVGPLLAVVIVVVIYSFALSLQKQLKSP